VKEVSREWVGRGIYGDVPTGILSKNKRHRVGVSSARKRFGPGKAIDGSNGSGSGSVFTVRKFGRPMCWSSHKAYRDGLRRLECKRTSLSTRQYFEGALSSPAFIFTKKLHAPLLQQRADDPHELDCCKLLATALALALAERQERPSPRLSQRDVVC
jgi:hypothetical protein